MRNIILPFISNNEEIKTTITGANESLEINEATFHEMVRRIPAPKLMVIETSLERVTPLHIDALFTAMTDQKHLLDDASFIRDEMFPFAALKAVRMGKISSLQFGTLMALWGSLDIILTDPDAKNPAKPEFVPLFTVAGNPNPRASILLTPTLRPPAHLPNLITKRPEELLKGIYDKAFLLPLTEQGFWVVEKIPYKSITEDTVTQRIKSLGVTFLAFNDSDKSEMIPSFGLQQVFLEAAFPHAVRINPVIGDSTPIDIRKGSAERYRDIALPFPGNDLPKVADTFPAPSGLDFMFHDRYHSVRASKVTPQETALYVAIGDSLNTIQKRYDTAVKEFSRRHGEHTLLLPEFGRAIEKLPAITQRKITEQILTKFNQEITIINTLKKIRKLMGQLKFLAWDMERPYSGTLVDRPGTNAFEEFRRIIANIMSDLGIFIEQIDLDGLSKYSGRRVAHAVVETVKPEASVLIAMQSQIRQGRAMQRFFSPSLPPELPGLQSFCDVLLEAPVGPSQESKSF